MGFPDGRGDFLQGAGGLNIKVEHVVESGLGLFPCVDFSVCEIVTIYLGRVIKKNMDSIYSMIKDLMVMDVQQWSDGENYSNETYLGAHMVNGRNWEKEDDETKSGNCETNTIV